MRCKFYQLTITDPRPTEVEGATATKPVSVFNHEEGSTLYSREFIMPLETDLQLKRTFAVVGQEYKILLRADNMHNEEDFALMEW